MCRPPVQTFGVMGGLYAAVNCFMVRLRQKNDGACRAPPSCTSRHKTCCLAEQGECFLATLCLAGVPH